LDGSLDPGLLVGARTEQKVCVVPGAVIATGSCDFAWNLERMRRCACAVLHTRYRTPSLRAESVPSVQPFPHTRVDLLTRKVQNSVLGGATESQPHHSMQVGLPVSPICPPNMSVKCAGPCSQENHHRREHQNNTSEPPAASAIIKHGTPSSCLHLVSACHGDMNPTLR